MPELVTNWTWKITDEGHGHQWTLEAQECQIDIFPRPSYCDRGNWIAYVTCLGYPRNPNPFDQQDGFPRYYLNLQRAKLEMEAMMEKRGYTPK